MPIEFQDYIDLFNDTNGTISLMTDAIWAVASAAVAVLIALMVIKVVRRAFTKTV